VERIKKAEKHKFIFDEIIFWCRKHEKILDLKISKKVLIGDRIVKIL